MTNWKISECFANIPANMKSVMHTSGAWTPCLQSRDRSGFAYFTNDDHLGNQIVILSDGSWEHQFGRKETLKGSGRGPVSLLQYLAATKIVTDKKYWK